jgi:hypothetical protein
MDGQHDSHNPDDEVEESLRRFGEFIKETFRKATPGERLIAFLNVVLIVVAIVAATIYGMQLEEMQRANRLTRATLELSQRPWLIADVRLVGPLKFDKMGGVTLPVWYSLKNTGHSPALKVWPSVEMFLPRNPETEPNMERDKLCARADDSSSHMGQAVFPSGAAPDPTSIVGTAVGKEDIQRGQILNGFIIPTVILCIAYQATLDNEWHHTGMIFEVHKIENGQPFAIKIGQDVPQDHLSFSLSFFHGISAD